MDGEHITRCFVESRVGAQADCGCRAIKYRGFADWFEVCERHKAVAPEEYLERRDKLLKAASDEVSRYTQTHKTAWRSQNCSGRDDATG